MIIDTSALIALVKEEAGAIVITQALAAEDALLPAPVFVEFERVTFGFRGRSKQASAALLPKLLAHRTTLLAFSADHARAAAAANAVHGTGNGRGGTLNLLDLMVYACAKVEGRPILCTGRDFAATDAAIHPASRIEN